MSETQKRRYVTLERDPKSGLFYAALDGRMLENQRDVRIKQPLHGIRTFTVEFVDLEHAKKEAFAIASPDQQEEMIKAAHKELWEPDTGDRDCGPGS